VPQEVAEPALLKSDFIATRQDDCQSTRRILVLAEDQRWREEASTIFHLVDLPDIRTEPVLTCSILPSSVHGLGSFDHANLTSVSTNLHENDRLYCPAIKRNESFQHLSKFLSEGREFPHPKSDRISDLRTSFTFPKMKGIL
jgi:hypothetical protein